MHEGAAKRLGDGALGGSEGGVVSAPSQTFIETNGGGGSRGISVVEGTSNEEFPLRETALRGEIAVLIESMRAGQDFGECMHDVIRSMWRHKNEGEIAAVRESIRDELIDNLLDETLRQLEQGNKRAAMLVSCLVRCDLLDDEQRHATLQRLVPLIPDKGKERERWVHLLAATSLESFGGWDSWDKECRTEGGCGMSSACASLEEGQEAFAVANILFDVTRLAMLREVEGDEADPLVKEAMDKVTAFLLSRGGAGLLDGRFGSAFGFVDKVEDEAKKAALRKRTVELYYRIIEHAGKALDGKGFDVPTLLTHYIAMRHLLYAELLEGDEMKRTRIVEEVLREWRENPNDERNFVNLRALGEVLDELWDAPTVLDEETAKRLVEYAAEVEEGLRGRAYGYRADVKDRSPSLALRLIGQVLLYDPDSDWVEPGSEGAMWRLAGAHALAEGTAVGIPVNSTFIGEIIVGWRRAKWARNERPRLVHTLTELAMKGSSDSFSRDDPFRTLEMLALSGGLSEDEVEEISNTLLTFLYEDEAPISARVRALGLVTELPRAGTESMQSEAWKDKVRWGWERIGEEVRRKPYEETREALYSGGVIPVLLEDPDLAPSISQWVLDDAERVIQRWQRVKENASEEARRYELRHLRDTYVGEFKELYGYLLRTNAKTATEALRRLMDGMEEGAIPQEFARPVLRSVLYRLMRSDAWGEDSLEPNYTVGRQKAREMSEASRVIVEDEGLRRRVAKWWWEEWRKMWGGRNKGTTPKHDDYSLAAHLVASGAAEELLGEQWARRLARELANDLAERMERAAKNTSRYDDISLLPYLPRVVVKGATDNEKTARRIFKVVKSALARLGKSARGNGRRSGQERVLFDNALDTLRLLLQQRLLPTDEDYDEMARMLLTYAQFGTERNLGREYNDIVEMLGHALLTVSDPSTRRRILHWLYEQAARSPAEDEMPNDMTATMALWQAVPFLPTGPQQYLVHRLTSWVGEREGKYGGVTLRSEVAEGALEALFMNAEEAERVARTGAVSVPPLRPEDKRSVADALLHRIHAGELPLRRSLPVIQAMLKSKDAEIAGVAAKALRKTMRDWMNGRTKDKGAFEDAYLSLLATGAYLSANRATAIQDKELLTAAFNTAMTMLTRDYRRALGRLDHSAFEHAIYVLRVMVEAGALTREQIGYFRSSIPAWTMDYLHRTGSWIALRNLRRLRELVSE